MAHIGVQVADALNYAHQRGVLHRDIKPSNLIVDQQGIVWVTDFGLAKAMEDDSVSRTGDVVGTLQYMAPEQLHGNTDARSDIYSLGLTLYETLALRPAYKAPDPSSLMRKISQESPPRLASVAPGIPRDLETIIMKAVSREPAHRYQSAGELAEDLRLLLEDRPIRARRVSSVEHLWRWCRRNRVVAGLAATALTLLVLVAVVASVGYVRTNNALAGESDQRRKADATSRLAIEALDDIFEQFVPERMFDSADSSGSEIQVPVQPVLSKEAASLLERLLVFYDRHAAEGSGDVNLRRKSADANRRVGDIRAALGQFDQAQAAYLTAIDTYRQIEERLSAGSSVAVEIARIYNSLGELQIPAGSPHASRSFHLKALETLDRAATTANASPAVRFEMARTCYSLGQDAGTPPMTFGAPPPPPGQHREPPPGGPHGMTADAPPPFSDPSGSLRPAARDISPSLSNGKRTNSSYDVPSSCWRDSLRSSRRSRTTSICWPAAAATCHPRGPRVPTRSNSDKPTERLRSWRNSPRVSLTFRPTEPTLWRAIFVLLRNSIQRHLLRRRTGCRKPSASPRNWSPNIPMCLAMCCPRCRFTWPCPRCSGVTVGRTMQSTSFARH